MEKSCVVNPFGSYVVDRIIVPKKDVFEVLECISSEMAIFHGPSRDYSILQE